MSEYRIHPSFWLQSESTTDTHTHTLQIFCRAGWCGFLIMSFLHKLFCQSPSQNSFSTCDGTRWKCDRSQVHTRHLGQIQDFLKWGEAPQIKGMGTYSHGCCEHEATKRVVCCSLEDSRGFGILDALKCTEHLLTTSTTCWFPLKNKISLHFYDEFWHDWDRTCRYVNLKRDTSYSTILFNNNYTECFYRRDSRMLAWKR